MITVISIFVLIILLAYPVAITAGIVSITKEKLEQRRFDKEVERIWNERHKNTRYR